MTRSSSFEPPDLARLLGLGEDEPLPPDFFAEMRIERPDLRRPEPESPQVITVRVDLEHAAPPIWRRLELRSDLTLAAVHGALQLAFGWAGYHLWRFAAGGGVFARESQLFLCPFDVAEGEDDGIPAGEVRIGELLQELGDRLDYVYDYGDDWGLRIIVESVRPADDDAPPARATGGRRSGPPEDCGGVRDAEGLAELLEDPAAFDLAALDALLREMPLTPQATADGPTPPALLIGPMRALGPGPAGIELQLRAAQLVLDAREPEELDDEHALRAITWFLEQADADGGIPLTAAGYLKPATVRAACDVVPGMDGWLGALGREVDCAPLLFFREELQRLGFLRKYKGSLKPSRLARAALRAGTVRDLVVESLIPEPGGFEHDGEVLLLTYVATTEPGTPVALDAIAAAAAELGWRARDGSTLREAVTALPAWSILANIGDRPGAGRDGFGAFSAEATAIAREVIVG